MGAQPAETEPPTFYAKHKKIYPREVSGKFSRLRVISLLALLGIYYLTPLLQWGDRQAVLFDLPARKFYIFGLTLWPQDFIYLAAILILAGLSLFFFTALLGRVWCGYACPQTVWTEAYLWMERKIEGNRSKRMNPIDVLIGKLFSASLGPWETFWILFYSFATYGNAGFMREQVCLYMCPYARFQSAMFDSDTLIVAYHPERGEPRGSRRRGTDPNSIGLGDCIDCNVCVQACPTGIDIRDGLQYECIACSLCIDACDEIMDKMSYPRGLIKYTTENSAQGKSQHVLRPRIMVYATILLVLCGALFVHIAQRIALDLDVIRDRNTLYRETRDGLIENVYTLKILNMDSNPHRYILSADGIDGLKLVTDQDEIMVEAGSVYQIVVRLQADEFNLEKRSVEVNFHLQATDANHLVVVEEARFVGPGKS